jgi:hypothetical protein
VLQEGGVLPLGCLPIEFFVVLCKAPQGGSSNCTGVGVCRLVFGALYFIPYPTPPKKIIRFPFGEI